MFEDKLLKLYAPRKHEERIIKGMLFRLMHKGNYYLFSIRERKDTCVNITDSYLNKLHNYINFVNRLLSRIRL